MAIKEEPIGDQTFDELEARTQTDKPIYDLRKLRDIKLQETDWWGAGDRPAMSDEQKAYRQALRDLTDTTSPRLNTYPDTQLDESSFDWPVKPE